MKIGVLKKYLELKKVMQVDPNPLQLTEGYQDKDEFSRVDMARIQLSTNPGKKPQQRAACQRLGPGICL